MRLADLRTGGKAALARALSAVETRREAPETVALLDEAEASPVGHSIGLTGPPGVGKSTLIDALIRELRGRGRTLAIIAVDPSSRASGGALLGDRTRFATDPADTGLFVRSMAARDRLGGVAEITYPALVLMRALFDVVIVETVGVGQSEIEIAGIADTVVLCAQPGAGDALQFMKAGLMEVPDLVVVTKADTGAPARRALADLKGALSLSASGQSPPVLAVSAATGEGIADLAASLSTRYESLEVNGALEPLRRAQSAHWIEANLVDRFGRAGFAKVRTALQPNDGEGHFAMAARIGKAFGEILNLLKL